ncbi:MAG: glycosyltransferase family 2 protein [Gemmatimonadetes bacterium]|nr:glycosyltransferase family 2 protein [Gemmatimonadota bacterium]NNM03960.1 glycosyltransferase family 2 protein [Gemmatimonadota bacterium]
MLRLDKKNIPSGSQEIRLFSGVRNEILRLPYWLDHHRRLGVDRFFVADNDSGDGTREALLEEPDVHVFHTAGSFHESDSGRRWISHLMEEYAVGRWCVVADADELLAPPLWEDTDLHRVAGFLDSEGSEALPCYLLDMYSSLPIRDTEIPPRSNPFDLCPYFDPDFEARDGNFVYGDQKHTISTVSGSTRTKVFGVRAYLSKIGMLKYRPGMVLTSGQHAILGAREAEIRGVMFHFKFLADFVEKTAMELDRDERKTYAHEWTAYEEALRENPDLSLFDDRSVRVRDSRQLLELGIMKTTPAYEAAVRVESV